VGVCAAPSPTYCLARLTGLAVLAILWTGLWDRATHGPSPLGWMQWAGVLAMLAGVLLRCVAIGQLGSRFVTELAAAGDQALVQDGVYRFIRHPSETGLLAAAAGVCLLMASLPAALLWALLLVPLVLWRVHVEDRHLRATFGDSFARYARRTKGLFPLLY